MHIISKSRLVTVLTILIIAAFGGKAGTAHAQEVNMGPDYSSCYSYTGLGYTTPTVSVNLKTSGGQTSTITIPNQNPPSILQSMGFQINTNCGWMWNGFTDTSNGIQTSSNGGGQYGLKFLTSSGTSIPYAGSPFSIAYAPDDYFPGYGYYAYLGWWYYDGLSDMGYSAATEDAVVNNIASTGNFQNQATGYGSYYPNNFANVSAPATNCVALSGTGPKKIVFMRGSGLSGNVSDFLVQVNDIINNGFRSIDPFRKYDNLNTFSYYVDLKKVDQSTLSKTASGRYLANASQVTSVSSCGASANEYVFVFNDPSIYIGYTEFNKRVVYINAPALIADGQSLAQTTIHESGHQLGYLYDEYNDPSRPDGDLFGLDAYSNCTYDPRIDYTYGNHIYGVVGIRSCLYNYNGAGYTPVGGTNPLYYRPSNDSIMNTGVTSSKFNVISCGYLVASFKGEVVDKAHAQTHWDECEGLDTIKDGYAVLAPAPTVDQVVPVPNSNNTFTTSGSGFSSTGNSIKLTPVTITSKAPSSVLPASSYSGFQLFKDFFQKLVPQAHGQTTSTGGTYVIDGVTSNGSGLTFSVPATTPDGTYTVSVAGANSPWTTTTQTITVSGNGAGDPTTAIGSAVSGGGGTGGTGTGTGTGTSGTTSGNTVAGTPVPSVAATAAIKYTYYNEPFTGCLSGEVSVENPGSPGQYFCQHATTTYTCPATYVLSGTTCNPSPAYTCPTGYALNGSTCIFTPTGSLPTSVLATVGCVGGSFYTLSPPGSTSPYNNNTSYYHCVYVNGATGLWTDYGRATNICPAGYLTGLPTYNNLDAYNGTALCKPVVTPTSLTGVAGTGVNGISVGKVSLSWSNPTYALTASNILVEAASNDGAYSVIATLSGSANSYIDTGISLSTNRKYQIRVLFSNGAYGSYSNSISVTVPSVSYFPSPKLSLIQNWATGTTKPELQAIENLYYLLPDMSAYTSSPARVSVERSVSSSTGFVEVGTSNDFSLDSKGKWTSSQNGWAMPAYGAVGTIYYMYTDNDRSFSSNRLLSSSFQVC